MNARKARVGAMMSIGVDIVRDVFHLVRFDPCGELCDAQEDRPPST